MYNYDYNELYHYGVLGMKWGVRRGVNELKSSTRIPGYVDMTEHNRGVATLTTHLNKSSKKLDKLISKRTNLDSKKLKYEAKANTAKNKWIQTPISKSKAEKYTKKSSKKTGQILKNESMQLAFKQGISDIKKALIDSGKNFLYMKKDGTPYAGFDDGFVTTLEAAKTTKYYSNAKDAIEKALENYKNNKSDLAAGLMRK